MDPLEKTCLCRCWLQLTPLTYMFALQEYAADASQMSGFWYDDDDEEKGGDALMVNGFGPLVEALSLGLNIRLGAEVHRIVQGKGR